MQTFQNKAVLLVGGSSGIGYATALLMAQRGAQVYILADRDIDKAITTAAFGGPELRTLYVTSASVLAPASERLAGSLWAFECETPGLPAHCVHVNH